MALELFDTLAAKTKPFTTHEPGHARVYVCGPTVQDVAHLGHARSFTVFDTLIRHLRSTGLRVTFVRNITDIDDKIVAKAKVTGEDPIAYARRVSVRWAEDMDTLGNMRPDIEPRVSDHIAEIIEMTAGLVGKGAAYVAKAKSGAGDVYFRVSAFPEYGKLSHRRVENLEAGASGRTNADEDSRKEHPADFALWKATEEGEFGWDSPWGKGKPGWHIECSAMAMKHLGECLDLHGGGLDLVFPHHENEIAQTEAMTGKPFSTVWMHHGFIEVNKEKMSKSLGNFFTIRDVFAYVEPESIRYYVLSVQYRSPMNLDWSLDADNRVSGFPGIEDAERRVEYVYTTLERFRSLGEDRVVAGGVKAPDGIAKFKDALTRALDDDLNTPIALGTVYEMLRAVNELLDGSAKKAGRLAPETRDSVAAAFGTLHSVLGLGGADPRRFLESVRGRRAKRKGITDEHVQAQIAARRAARDAKDFQRADAIRAELTASGVELMDSPAGTTWRIP